MIIYFYDLKTKLKDYNRIKRMFYYDLKKSRLSAYPTKTKSVIVVEDAAEGMADRFFANHSPANLLAANGHFGGPAKPQLYPIAMHLQHGNLDIFANHHRLAALATENQHGVILLPPQFLALGFLMYGLAGKRVRRHRFANGFHYVGQVTDGVPLPESLLNPLVPAGSCR